MARKTSRPIKAQAPALSLEELTQQKIAAGLTPAQAASAAKRQLARDTHFADADDSGSDETT